MMIEAMGVFQFKTVLYVNIITDFQISKYKKCI
jgi:hypothetical protein